MLKFHYRNNTCLAALTLSATMPHMAVPSRSTTGAPDGLLHDSSAPALPHALYSACMQLLHTLYPASGWLSGAGQASPSKAIPRCLTPGCAQAGRCPLQAERYAGQPPALALLLLAPGVRVHQEPAGAPLPQPACALSPCPSAAVARVRKAAVAHASAGWTDRPRSPRATTRHRPQTARCRNTMPRTQFLLLTARRQHERAPARVVLCAKAGERAALVHRGRAQSGSGCVHAE